jgi:hypothetical protein
MSRPSWITNLTCGFAGRGMNGRARRLPPRSATPETEPKSCCKTCCDKVGALCRSAWDSEPVVWCRTHGLFTAVYFFIGSWAYYFMEGWETLDTCYFLIVSVTTVGFGDIGPETQAGRLFTSIYVVLGIFTLMSALSPIVNWLLEQRKHIEGAVEKAAEISKENQKTFLEKTAVAVVETGGVVVETGKKIGDRVADPLVDSAKAGYNTLDEKTGIDANVVVPVSTKVKAATDAAFKKVSFGFGSAKSVADSAANVVDHRLALLADADGDGVLDEDELAALMAPSTKVDYTARYLRALSAPLFVFVVGILIAIFILEHSFIDAFFFVTTTMTTIGYGGLNFINDADGNDLPKWVRYVGIFYLPLAVTALADAASELARLSVRRRIRETDYAGKVDQLLLEEAKGNPLETLTEAEFLVSVLKSHDLVDDATLRAIRIQFASITRHTRPKAGEDPVLDAKAVFAELKQQGRIGDIDRPNKKRGGAKSVTTDAAAAADEETKGAEFDVLQAPVNMVKFVVVPPSEKSKVGQRECQVDLKALDGGYKEWYERHWLPRVLGREDLLTDDANVFADEEAGSGKSHAKFRLLSSGGFGGRGGPHGML